ncbi:MAG: hypothetical protein U0S50_06640 [Sphingopyxis sp.]|uniref:hypothetical protein n=1 Tax=Sphingopyxis sp. TaxID=1908224 RepID=UPI002ABCD2BF|nr:hypothetical protein [Sphingopyxis sp.]MDZ3831478.1 hypothetical protein [Sphingopyxis sp.]
MKEVKQRMCVINPALVDDIAPLVGGQADIMRRIGISWNTWIKINGGHPVRYSLAQRLKARVVANAEQVETLGRKFPSECGGVDRDALDDAFLLSSAS